MKLRKREWVRRPLLTCLRVLDTQGQEIGTVIELGVRGATLRHQGSLPVGDTLVLVLELPEPLEGENPLELDVVVRWTRPDTVKGSLKTGVEFVDMTTERLRVLSLVFDSFTKPTPSQ